MSRSQGVGFSGKLILSPQEVSRRIAENEQALHAQSGQGDEASPKTPAALPQPRTLTPLRNGWTAVKTPILFVDLSTPASTLVQTAEDNNLKFFSKFFSITPNVAYKDHRESIIQETKKVLEDSSISPQLVLKAGILCQRIFEKTSDQEFKDLGLACFKNCHDRHYADGAFLQRYATLLASAGSFEASLEVLSERYAMVNGALNYHDYLAWAHYFSAVASVNKEPELVQNLYGIALACCDFVKPDWEGGNLAHRLTYEIKKIKEHEYDFVAPPYVLERIRKLATGEEAAPVPCSPAAQPAAGPDSPGP